MAAGIELMIGGVFLLIVALLAGEFTGFSPQNVSLKSALSLMYLIVFGSIVTFTAYVWLLQITPATRVATHTYVNPVIAVLLGWSIGGEEFTFITLIACAIIVLSIYLVLAPGRRSGRAIPG
jgi:drug/metabolite transporter (DMT)-like permease